MNHKVLLVLTTLLLVFGLVIEVEAITRIEKDDILETWGWAIIFSLLIIGTLQLICFNIHIFLSIISIESEHDEKTIARLKSQRKSKNLKSLYDL